MASFPDDWYWLVTGDTNVWSSNRFAYVVPTDAAYQVFLGAGNNVSLIADRPTLSNTMTGLRLADYLQGGLVVTCTGNAQVSATYALDPVTINQVGTVARDSKSGLGLPGGLASFTYPDSSSAPHSMTAVQVQNLYKAMRDYVFLLNLAIVALVFLTPGALLPTNVVTIP